MKNQFILWSASLIIVFLIGYIKAVTSINYPITGTFGIEGKKVSYKLNKTCYGQSSCKNIVLSDIKGLKGKIIISDYNMKNEIVMTETEKGLTGEIPALKPGKNLFYKINLGYKDKIYNIPENGFVSLTFWGKIPSAVSTFYFILLYSSLLMSCRSALELFNKNKLLKKFAFITCVLFIPTTVFISPLYNSYKIGAINNFVPPFGELFDPALILIMLVWITATVSLFFKKNPVIVTVTSVLITIILFFLLESV